METDWYQVNNFSIDENSHIVRVLFTNNNLEYKGPSKLYYHTVPVTKFIPILGLDDKNNIIENSNSFLVDNNFRSHPFNHLKNYDSEQKIFTGLQLTYDNIKKLEPQEIVEEPMFLLFNPFSGRNVGHDLSILFHRIHLYRQMQLDIPIIVGDTMLEFPFSLEICKLLLPNSKLYFLKSNTIVHFKNIIITRNVIFDINRYTYLHKEIISRCIDNCDNVEKYRNKKVFLVKNLYNQKNVFSTFTGFYVSDLINILEQNYGFIIINPETMVYNEIILYLSLASKIVVSYGAIMYGNAIFFNEIAKLYYITTDLNRTPYYSTEKYKTILFQDNNLDNNINYFLSNIEEI